MPKRYQFTEEQKEELNNTFKLSEEKREKARLQALRLSICFNMPNEQISQIVFLSVTYIKRLVSLYENKGLPCKKILMFVDHASFHSSKGLKIPLNIRLFPILAHSPELNPVEVLWKYIRGHFFKNEIFDNIDGVVDRLCDAFKTLTDLPEPDIIRSISAWDWIITDSFN